MSCVFGAPVYGDIDGQLETSGGALDMLTDKVWEGVCKHLGDSEDYAFWLKLAVIKRMSPAATRESLIVYLTAPSVGNPQAVGCVSGSDGIPPCDDSQLMESYATEELLVDKSCVRACLKRMLLRQEPLWIDVKVVIFSQEEIARLESRGEFKVIENTFVEDKKL